MGFTEKDLKKSVYPLIGFSGKKIKVIGKADINVTFSQGVTMRTKVITFKSLPFSTPTTPSSEKHYQQVCGNDPLAIFMYEDSDSWGSSVCPRQSRGGLKMRR
jgi:hypothetical protein